MGRRVGAAEAQREAAAGLGAGQPGRQSAAEGQRCSRLQPTRPPTSALRSPPFHRLGRPVPSGFTGSCFTAGCGAQQAHRQRTDRAAGPRLVRRVRQRHRVQLDRLGQPRDRLRADRRHARRCTCAARRRGRRPLSCPPDSEYFGVDFRLGAYLPMFPPAGLVDLQDAVLPTLPGGRVLLDGDAWEMPTPKNVDVFVDRLVRAGLLVVDPLVEDLRHGDVRGMPERTAQSRFVRAVGLSRRKLHVIERARRAARQLRAGTPIADVVFDAGYHDQPHLTRSLRGVGRLHAGRGGPWRHVPGSVTCASVQDRPARVATLPLRACHHQLDLRHPRRRDPEPAGLAVARRLQRRRRPDPVRAAGAVRRGADGSAHLRRLRAGVVGPLGRPVQRPHERAAQVRRLDDPHRPEVAQHDRHRRTTRSTPSATSSSSPARASCSTASVGCRTRSWPPGLLDELRLWVHPFFVGTGTADDLLYRAGSTGRFDLVGSTTLDSGIVILSYRSRTP